MGDRLTGTTAAGTTQAGVKLVGGLLIAGGTMMLLGWARRLPAGEPAALALPGPATGIAFVLAGTLLLGGLWQYLATRAAPTPRSGARAMLLLAAVIGVLSLTHPAAAVALAGPMPGTLAGIIAAIAATLWLVCARNPLPVAAGQVGATLILAAVSVTILDVSAPEPFVTTEPFAVLLRPATLVLLTLLAVGMLVMRADHGLVRFARELEHRYDGLWWLLPLALMLPLAATLALPGLWGYARPPAQAGAFNATTGTGIATVAIAGVLLALFTVLCRPRTAPSALLQQVAGSLDRLPGAICVRNERGEVLATNAEWRSLERDLGQAGDAPSLLHPIESVLARTAGWQTVDRVLVHHGQRHVYRCSEFVLGDNAVDGRLVGTLVEDVTAEREQAERDRAVADRLRLALQSGDLGMITCQFDPDQCQLDARALRIMGLDPEHFDGRLDTLLDCIDGEDREHVVATLRQARARAGRLFIEFRVRRGERLRHVRWRGIFRSYSEGHIAELSGVLYDMAEKRALESELETVRKRLQAVMEGAPMGHWIRDVQCGVAYHDEANHRVFGRSPGEISGRIEDTIALVHPEDRERVLAEMQAAQASGSSCHLQFRARGPEHTDRQLMSRVSFLPDDSGNTRYAIGVTWDVEQRREAQTQLAQLSTRLSSTLDRALLLDSELRVITASEGLLAATGLEPATSTGLPVTELIAAADATPVEQTVTARGSWAGSVRLINTDGQRHPAWARISGLLDENGLVRFYIATLYEPTSPDAGPQSGSAAPGTDALTGVLDRETLLAELERALAAEAATPADCTLLISLDLDRFSVVNDTRGQRVGDEVLRILAARLQESVGADFAVARTMGDEFMIAGPVSDERALWQTLAEQVLAEVRRPMDLDGRTLTVTGSVGVAVAPPHADETDALVRAANTARAAVAAEGGNGYRIFETGHGRRSPALPGMRSDFNHALANREFSIEFQPLIDLTIGHPCGAEARLQWQHPHIGRVSPGRFMSLLEESARVQAMGRWLLDTACRAAVGWQLADGQGPPVLSVPVSPRQFRDSGLASIVAEVLESTGMAPARLRLSVDEGALMRNPFEGRKQLGALQALGIELAIDEFGTGCSALGYLRNFPVTSLRIDRRVIKGLSTEHGDQAITRSITGMAESLGLTVVAEGVENSDQLRFLVSTGCHQAQGELFSAPLSASDCERFLQPADPVGERSHHTAPDRGHSNAMDWR